MAVGPEAIRLAQQQRLTIQGVVDDETRRLVRAWARAWDQIVAELEAAAADLAATDPPYTMTQVLRADRARNALLAAQDQIGRIAAAADVNISGAVADLVPVTADLDAAIIAAQFPSTSTVTAVTFSRVDADALAAIVQRSTEQIYALTKPLSEDAAASMLRALTKAVPQGLSPRDAAARMIRNAEGGFNGGLTRALTIARTEILDASRSASAAQQSANSDVLQGWQWYAELDDRTCSSCVAMAGTIHTLHESGPDDHQNGRCSRMPYTLSWADLGFSIDEPPDRLQDGPTWFAAQPESTQLAVMGPGRLEAIKSGRATVADMATKRSTVGWRDSYSPTPVSVLA